MRSRAAVRRIAAGPAQFCAGIRLRLIRDSATAAHQGRAAHCAQVRGVRDVDMAGQIGSTAQCGVKSCQDMPRSFEAESIA